MDKKHNRGAMLVISVLIHSLLALLPWQEKPRPLAVSSTPTGPISPASPISIVDASQLPTLSESEPVPFSPPVPDTPIPETSDSPEPIPEVVPEADWIADAPIPEMSAPPASETAPNNDPIPVTSADDEAKFAADLEHLVGYLKGQDKGFGFKLFDIFKNFGETGQANQFFYEEDQPKLNVSSFSHFPEQTPEQVLQTVVIPELTSSTGFDPQPSENVSVGLVYQLLQGEMLRYLIIVRLREGEGSVLMLSESLAGLEL
ncbi:MAG: hypothetical protein AAF572_25840 [Cyanobacteria bacterium P01_B01_bin.77]